jgi:hypothetical protein
MHCGPVHVEWRQTRRLSHGPVHHEFLAPGVGRHILPWRYFSGVCVIRIVQPTVDAWVGILVQKPEWFTARSTLQNRSTHSAGIGMMHTFLLVIVVLVSIVKSSGSIVSPWASKKCCTNCARHSPTKPEQHTCGQTLPADFNRADFTYPLYSPGCQKTASHTCYT